MNITLFTILALLAFVHCQSSSSLSVFILAPNASTLVPFSDSFVLIHIQNGTGRLNLTINLLTTAVFRDDIASFLSQSSIQCSVLSPPSLAIATSGEAHLQVSYSSTNPVLQIQCATTSSPPLLLRLPFVPLTNPSPSISFHIRPLLSIAASTSRTQATRSSTRAQRIHKFWAFPDPTSTREGFTLASTFIFLPGSLNAFPVLSVGSDGSASVAPPRTPGLLITTSSRTAPLLNISTETLLDALKVSAGVEVVPSLANTTAESATASVQRLRGGAHISFAQWMLPAARSGASNGSVTITSLSAYLAVVSGPADAPVGTFKDVVLADLLRDGSLSPSLWRGQHAGTAGRSTAVADVVSTSLASHAAACGVGAAACSLALQCSGQGGNGATCSTTRVMSAADTAAVTFDIAIAGPGGVISMFPIGGTPANALVGHVQLVISARFGAHGYPVAALPPVSRVMRFGSFIVTNRTFSEAKSFCLNPAATATTNSFLLPAFAYQSNVLRQGDSYLGSSSCIPPSYPVSWTIVYRGYATYVGAALFSIDLQAANGTSMARSERASLGGSWYMSVGCGTSQHTCKNIAISGAAAEFYLHFADDHLQVAVTVFALDLLSPSLLNNYSLVIIAAGAQGGVLPLLADATDLVPSAPVPISYPLLYIYLGSSLFCVLVCVCAFAISYCNIMIRRRRKQEADLALLIENDAKKYDRLVEFRDRSRAQTPEINIAVPSSSSSSVRISVVAPAALDDNVDLDPVRISVVAPAALDDNVDLDPVRISVVAPAALDDNVDLDPANDPANVPTLDLAPSEPSNVPEDLSTKDVNTAGSRPQTGSRRCSVASAGSDPSIRSNGSVPKVTGPDISLPEETVAAAAARISPCSSTSFDSVVPKEPPVVQDELMRPPNFDIDAVSDASSTSDDMPILPIHPLVELANWYLCATAQEAESSCDMARCLGTDSAAIIRGRDDTTLWEARSKALQGYLISVANSNALYMDFAHGLCTISSRISDLFGAMEAFAATANSRKTPRDNEGSMVHIEQVNASPAQSYDKLAGASSFFLGGPDSPSGIRLFSAAVLGLWALCRSHAEGLVEASTSLERISEIHSRLCCQHRDSPDIGSAQRAFNHLKDLDVDLSGILASLLDSFCSFRAAVRQTSRQLEAMDSNLCDTLVLSSTLYITLLKATMTLMEILSTAPLGGLSVAISPPAPENVDNILFSDTLSLFSLAHDSHAIGSHVCLFNERISVAHALMECITTVMFTVQNVSREKLFNLWRFQFELTTVTGRRKSSQKSEISISLDSALSLNRIDELMYHTTHTVVDTTLNLLEKHFFLLVLERNNAHISAGVSDSVSAGVVPITPLGLVVDGPQSLVWWQSAVQKHRDASLTLSSYRQLFVSHACVMLGALHGRAMDQWLSFRKSLIPSVVQVRFSGQDAILNPTYIVEKLSEAASAIVSSVVVHLSAGSTAPLSAASQVPPDTENAELARPQNLALEYTHVLKTSGDLYSLWKSHQSTIWSEYLSQLASIDVIPQTEMYDSAEFRCVGVGAGFNILPDGLNTFVAQVQRAASQLAALWFDVVASCEPFQVSNPLQAVARVHSEYRRILRMSELPEADVVRSLENIEHDVLSCFVDTTQLGKDMERTLHGKIDEICNLQHELRQAFDGAYYMLEAGEMPHLTNPHSYWILVFIGRFKHFLGCSVRELFSRCKHHLAVAERLGLMLRQQRTTVHEHVLVTVERIHGALLRRTNASFLSVLDSLERFVLFGDLQRSCISAQLRRVTTYPDVSELPGFGSLEFDTPLSPIQRLSFVEHRIPLCRGSLLGHLLSPLDASLKQYTTLIAVLYRCSRQVQDVLHFAASQYCRTFSYAIGPILSLGASLSLFVHRDKNYKDVQTFALKAFDDTQSRLLAIVADCRGMYAHILRDIETVIGELNKACDSMRSNSSDVPYVALQLRSDLSNIVFDAAAQLKFLCSVMSSEEKKLLSRLSSHRRGSVVESSILLEVVDVLFGSFIEGIVSIAGKSKVIFDVLQHRALSMYQKAFSEHLDTHGTRLRYSLREDHLESFEKLHASGQAILSSSPGRQNYFHQNLSAALVALVDILPLILKAALPLLRSLLADTGIVDRGRFLGVTGALCGMSAEAGVNTTRMAVQACLGPVNDVIAGIVTVRDAAEEKLTSLSDASMKQLELQEQLDAFMHDEESFETLLNSTIEPDTSIFIDVSEYAVYLRSAVHTTVDVDTLHAQLCNDTLARVLASNVHACDVFCKGLQPLQTFSQDALPSTPFDCLARVLGLFSLSVGEISDTLMSSVSASLRLSHTGVLRIPQDSLPHPVVAVADTSSVEWELSLERVTGCYRRVELGATHDPTLLRSTDVALTQRCMAYLLRVTSLLSNDAAKIFDAQLSARHLVSEYHNTLLRSTFESALCSHGLEFGDAASMWNLASLPLHQFQPIAIAYLDALRDEFLKLLDSPRKSTDCQPLSQTQSYQTGVESHLNSVPSAVERFQQWLLDNLSQKKFLDYADESELLRPSLTSTSLMSLEASSTAASSPLLKGGLFGGYPVAKPKNIKKRPLLMQIVQLRGETRRFLEDYDANAAQMQVPSYLSYVRTRATP